MNLNPPKDFYESQVAEPAFDLGCRGRFQWQRPKPEQAAQSLLF